MFISSNIFLQIAINFIIKIKIFNIFFPQTLLNIYLFVNFKHFAKTLLKIFIFP